MKINIDKRYLKFCIYVAVTCMAIYLFTVLVDYAPDIFGTIFDILGNIYDIISPFIIALVIVYLMYSPMRIIENFLVKRAFFKNHKGLCRGIGIAISYFAVLAVFVALLCGIYFMIGGQLSNSSTFANIVDTITEYFDDNSLSADSVQELIDSWNIPFGDFLNDKMGDIALFISDIIAGMLSGVGTFIFSIGSNILSFIISVVLSIYILISYEYFLNLWDKVYYFIFRKSKIGKDIRNALSIVNTTFSKYIHGQLIEAFLVFVMSAIALSIVGIDYAFVIAIICGVSNLIPYVGPLIGIVFAAIMALFSGDLLAIVWAVVALTIVQQIDCNILCPNIVGDIVGLNAAFTLIAISIGGDIGGLFGMLVAVPVAASIKTLTGDWFDRKMASDYEEYAVILHQELDAMAAEREEKFKASKNAEKQAKLDAKAAKKKAKAN